MHCKSKNQKNNMNSQKLRDEITRIIISLTEGEDDEIALMATMSCELYHGCEGYDWVGFYRVVAPELLKIGPYQGGHGCLTIPFERGVCGAAARTQKIQRIDDVNQFPGHIACSPSTQSEIVLPVFNAQHNLIAVLDIDSDQPAFFDQQQADWLAHLLHRCFSQC